MSTPAAEPALAERACGILLHPTSLPGPYGIGDLGPSAHRFAAWLASAGQRVWQVLPLGPLGHGDSPYSALSSFAGNELLVSPELLAARGWLTANELRRARLPEGPVDYGAVGRLRHELSSRAFARFSAEPARTPAKQAFARFAHEQRGWLEEWVLYRAIKRQQGERAFVEWPAELRDRERSALARARKELPRELDRERFVQWQFAAQWAELRARCHELGVRLLGDLPIYVAHDSADVWADRRLFRVDEHGFPTVVAGVPPDYFSRTGQRWGNPLYDWARHAKDGYAWWRARLSASLARVDALRLDHFIGFVRSWAIPRDEPTAVRGSFLPGPGEALFRAVRRELGALPFVAEDLGAVTPEVLALRDRLGLPGIRLLQFAFGTDPQAPSFRPHAWPRHAVVYSGTHDNDTAVGWLADPSGTGVLDAAARRERAYALRYLASDGTAFHRDVLRALYASVADLAIVPLQDALGLGSEARMNRPGTAVGNWRWRVPSRSLSPVLARSLRELAALYERVPARGWRSP